MPPTVALDPGAELRDAQARLSDVDEAIAGGRAVDASTLIEAERAVRHAEVRAELLQRRAAETAEAERLARIDEIGSELAATVLPLRADVERARLALTAALAHLAASAAAHNDALAACEHELTTLCHAGIPRGVVFDMPGLLRHFRAHGEHHYGVVDVRDQVGRALAAGIPNAGTALA